VLRDSLSERFRYEGGIGRFDWFAVLAAYFDESGDDRSDRIAVAVALAHEENWRQFEALWRVALDLANVTDYHAHINNNAHHALNRAMPVLVKECRILLSCTTVSRSDYMRVTNASDRSQLGNEYGFAGFVAISLMADVLRKYNQGDAGYYIDQGGKGFGKMIEILSYWYQRDRADFMMATYGPADRRLHMPLHPADLVAHEVITNREKSECLPLFGEHLAIQDLSTQQLREIFAQHRVIWAHLKREKQRLKNAAKRKRRGR